MSNALILDLLIGIGIIIMAFVIVILLRLDTTPDTIVVHYCSARRAYSTEPCTCGTIGGHSHFLASRKMYNHLVTQRWAC